MFSFHHFILLTCSLLIHSSLFVSSTYYVLRCFVDRTVIAHYDSANTCTKDSTYLHPIQHIMDQLPEMPAMAMLPAMPPPQHSIRSKNKNAHYRNNNTNTIMGVTIGIGTVDSPHTYNSRSSADDGMFSDGFASPFPKIPLTPVTPITPITPDDLNFAPQKTTSPRMHLHRQPQQQQPQQQDENNVNNLPAAMAKHISTARLRSPSRLSPVHTITPSRDISLHSPTESASLVDITNTNINTSRNYSITTSSSNMSTASIERKRGIIIDKLSMRHSKNISQPYFYQYRCTDNVQPKTSLPILPSPPNSPQNRSIQLFSDFNATPTDTDADADASRNADTTQHSSQDSLNFVNLGTASPTTVRFMANSNTQNMRYKPQSYSVGRRPQQTSGKSNNNKQNNRNAKDSTNNNNDNGNGERHPNESSGTAAGNGHGGNDDENGDSSSSYPTLGASADSTGTTGMGTSSSSSGNDTSQLIKQAQRMSMGMFSESSVNLNVNASKRFSDLTVATELLNFDMDSQPITEPTPISPKRPMLSRDLTKESIPEAEEFLADTVLTFKNYPKGDTATDFNMNRSTVSTISMSLQDESVEDGDEEGNDTTVATVKPMQVRPAQFPMHAHRPPPSPPQQQQQQQQKHEQHQHGLPLPQFSETLKHKRKPVTPSPSPSPSPLPLPLSGPESTSQHSNTSQDALLPHGNLPLLTKPHANRPSIHNPQQISKKPAFATDIEKNDFALNDNETKSEIARYGDCSMRTTITLLISGLLAPPLLLAIFLGHLDSVFGVMQRPWKLTALVMFTVYVLAAVLGIAVGLGVGLSRAP